MSNTMTLWRRGAAWTAAAFAVLALIATAGAAMAQDPAAPAEEAWPPVIPGVKWQVGPCRGALGKWSELEVPKDWSFTGASGARAFETAIQNPSSPNELGVVLPPRGEQWFAYFEYDDTGHVPDDEKADLDADDLLDILKKGNEAGNAERRRKGWPELHLVGWAEPPRYDDDLKVLVWATKATSGADTTINYDARLLGRTGVMRAGLVCSEAEFSSALPKFRTLCKSHAFVSGQRYAEYRSGDKVAEYGLAALVTGGVIAGAAKTGLLSKLWKFLVVGVLALIGGIKKLFGAKGSERVRRPRTVRTARGAAAPQPAGDDQQAQ